MFRRSHATLRSACHLAPWTRRSSTGQSGPQSALGKFWAWTTQPRPHWKESYTEAFVLCCVFGVTGSSSVALVRPALKSVFGIEGTLKDGPNSYRALSILIVSPIYACVLMLVGTLAGRHTYFANMGRKILGRFLPASLRQKIGCTPIFKPKVQPPSNPPPHNK